MHSRLLGAPQTRHGISPAHARLLVVVVGLLICFCDFLTPPDYDIAVFYGLGIAACSWTASRRFLWIATIFFIALVFVGATFGAPGHSGVSTFLNRLLICLALLIIASLVDRWTSNARALEEQRSVGKQLLETLDLARVIVRKVDGTILFWSCGAEELYGWTADEAVGKVTHSLFQTYFPEGLQEVNDAFLRGGRYNTELLHHRKDGRPIWVASHWTLTKDSMGAAVVTEVNNDITELKLAESRFRDFAEALPHLVWQLSPTGETVYVNQRWREYFGCEPGDISTSAIKSFVHPDDVSTSAERWKHAFETGRIDPWQARYRRHDGTYRWFSGHAVAVRNEIGQILHWWGTATDIQEEKLMQERLRETSKLDSVGRLAGGIAHDFNNLLTAIAGYNGLLNERVGADAVASGYCHEVQRASERATGLAKQLLAFSRPQLTRLQSVNLNTAVTGIRQMLGRLIGEDLNIVLDLSPGLPNILADPTQIDQVVMNLAVNARDAMPRGGTLRLATSTSTVEETEARNRRVKPGTYVQLIVRDSGTGLDEATKNRLFEPFFTTKDVGKGTGLGLSIVYGVVKHTGGFIDVDSALGVGTTFTLSFPVSQQKETPEAPSPTGQSRPAEQTILVVEDDQAVRHLVTDVLRKCGYKVMEAATPAAAIRLSHEYPDPIDLVISDVRMPQMRGPQLVRIIQELRPNILVLYMSGYTDTTFAESDDLQGAAYLQKPFQPSQLAKVVSQLVNSQT